MLGGGMSKAVVSRSVGSNAALERERAYVSRLADRRMARARGRVRGDRLGRPLWAIVTGLTITMAGYLRAGSPGAVEAVDDAVDSDPAVPRRSNVAVTRSRSPPGGSQITSTRSPPAAAQP